MSAASNWAKVDALLWSTPKLLRQAPGDRFWAGTVFQLLLLVNRQNRLEGEIPAGYAAPEYLAALCHLDNAPGLAEPPHDLIRLGLRAAALAKLIEVTPEGVLIVGWSEEWGRLGESSTERVRRWRAKKKAEATTEASENTLPKHETVKPLHVSGNGETPRVEESRVEESRSPDPTDPDARPGSGKGKAKGKRGPDPDRIPEQAHTLAQLLADWTAENVPRGTFARLAPAKRAARVLAWADVIRRMRVIDGHEWGEIQDMIEWSQRSEFWRANVQSAEALRKNWDTMLGQRGRPRRGDNGKPRDVRVGQAEPTPREAWENEPEEGQI